MVDSQTNNCFLTANLQPATGNGIYPPGGTLAVTSGGAGYLGAPLVTVSGGSGSGAMAIAQVTGGVITAVALTCPGHDYQVGDSVNFDFAGGGASAPASTFNYVLTANDVAANTAGGLVKLGTGLLNLTGANHTYTGSTIVSNGTLFISGALPGGGAVIVSGGTLGGSGTIAGPVSVANGAALTAGNGTPATLTVNNAVTLGSGATYSAKLDKGNTVQDLLQGVSTLTYGGTLAVTNLSGTLAVGDSFKLFDAATYAGAFTAIAPATPGVGLAWDASQLATSGTLKIIAGVTVNTTPTNIVSSVSGGILTLSWPADHTGWRLQAQTNTLAKGLGTNWVDVAGSATTNQVAVPVNQANGAVFYRLTY
ncbi:MAG TPA: autotransporter-associated beta strand repeat-containing protein [Verrucomicrobiae bacterium]